MAIYARQRGVNVYPVKGVPDDQIDYETLPNWMRKSHFFDIGQFRWGRWRNAKEWDTFVTYLKSDRLLAFRSWFPTCQTTSFRGNGNWMNC